MQAKDGKGRKNRKEIAETNIKRRWGDSKGVPLLQLGTKARRRKKKTMSEKGKACKAMTLMFVYAAGDAAVACYCLNSQALGQGVS